MKLCWQKFLDSLNGILKNLGQLQMAMKSTLVIIYFACLILHVTSKQFVCFILYS